MQRTIRVLALVGSLCIAALGLMGGGLGIVVGLLSPPAERLMVVLFSASFLALATGLGLAMAWQSWQAIQGRGSGPFRLGRLWLWVLVYVLSLVSGQLVLSLDLLPALFFPAFHIAASAIPLLILAGLAARALSERARWRDMVLASGSGAFLSTALAFTLEIAAVVGLLVAVVVVLAMQPGGAEALETLAGRLQDPTWLQDPAGQAGIPLSPWLVAGVLVVFAGVIPIIEEGVKTVGVGLLSYRRPGMAQAFLWGIAAGAGFALTENLFNTASGLALWAPAALARVGASLLHCFTGGLMGLAWYFLVAERRWGRVLVLYALSVAVHAAWNGLAAGMVLLSLDSTGAVLSPSSRALSSLGTLVLLGLMLLLGLGVIAAFAGLTLHVRRRSRVAAVPWPAGPEPVWEPEVGQTAAGDGG